MPKNKKMTPEEELKFLCDFSVKECVAYISEFTPGAEYVVPEDAETLIKLLQNTPDLTGVLLDGVTSVHRPSILSNHVVFYNRTEEEMLAHLEEIPRHEHVHWMFNQLMNIQDEWLGKFRTALPKTKIIYSIDSDDFHAMSERMLRVIVQSGKVKLKTSQKSLEKRKQELLQKLNGSEKIKVSNLQEKLRRLENMRRRQVEDRVKKLVTVTDRKINEVKADIALNKKLEQLETKCVIYKLDKKMEKTLKKTEEELNKVKKEITAKEQGLNQTLNILLADRVVAKVAGKQKERDALDEKIKKCNEEIKNIEDRITRLTDKMAELEEEFGNYREPETSPVYQRRVEDHIRQLYKRFYKLGENHNIKIVTKPDILVFDTLVIDYAHDRGRTWVPMPNRVKRLAKMYSGIMREYRQNLSAILKEKQAATNDIDVVLESGHHGVFFAQWQKLYLTAEEIRMQHVNTFYTGRSDGVKHVVYIAGMPFEPQDKIAEYLNRQKPARTRGGKPINSAHHPVFVRNYKQSVSGMQFIRKHQHGMISVEPIVYQLFSNKQVLEPFKAVMSQDCSDNHLNSPEMDPLGTIGTIVMNRQLMSNPLELYEQKVYIGGTINLGDTAEANSMVWREATKFRRNVLEAVSEIPSRLVATNLEDYESVRQTALFWANDMMGGANENQLLTMELVRWFFKEKFLTIFHHSPARLRDLLATLEGNHFAKANSSFSGIQEFSIFRERLLAWMEMDKDFPNSGFKPISLRIEMGGQPKYFQPEVDKSEIVVHLGGYSVGRQGIIEKYGIGHDGKLLVQKPYRVGLTHEPNEIVQKAINDDADLIKGGHTHDSYLMLNRSGDNMARIIDQKPCTQRVSATELSYGGLPRTSGVDLCVYTQPGRYFKMTIPMDHMRRIGLAQLKIDSKLAVDKKKK